MNSIKIAIISDIHSNIIALESFLNFIKNNFQADHILNLGDFVQIGPNPKEVVEIVLNDERFINILGNNELILFREESKTLSKAENVHVEWTKKQIDEDLLEKIRKLPTFRYLKFQNNEVYMSHSRKYNEDLSNLMDYPLLYQNKTINDFIEDYPTTSNIILFGHTHLPLYLNWKHKIFLNPASLGCPGKEKKYSFITLEIDKDCLNIKFHSIKYDISKIIQSFKEKNVPHMKALLKSFYGIKI